MDKDNFEQALYYGRVVLGCYLESQNSRSLLPEIEDVGQQLATLCVQMSEPVHAVYYFCLSACYAMKQGCTRIIALQHYHAEYQRCLNAPDLPAETYLYALALAASLYPMFFAIEQTVALLARPASHLTHELQWLADIEQNVSSALTQTFADFRSLLIQMIEHGGFPASIANDSKVEYRAHISLAFKKYLYEVLASLSVELKWRALWQILLGTNVLGQLFSPAAEHAEMGQNFFMMELQKLTMDAAFFIESCSPACLNDLMARPDLIKSIECGYPFLYKALPGCIKELTYEDVNKSVDEEVSGFTAGHMSSPPCRSPRSSSSAITPIRPYMADSPRDFSVATPVINGNGFLKVLSRL